MISGIHKAAASSLVASLAFALFVVACDDEPSTPTGAPSVEPPATATPVPTAIPTEMPTETVTPQPTQPAPTNTPTPVPSPTATPTANPLPTPIPPPSVSITDVDATRWTRNPDGSWTVDVELTVDVPERLRKEGFVVQVNGCGLAECLQDAGKEFVVDHDGSLIIPAALDLSQSRTNLEFKVDLRWPSSVADVSDTAEMVAVAPRLPDFHAVDVAVPVLGYNADGTSEVALRPPVHEITGLPFVGTYAIECAADSDCDLSIPIEGTFSGDAEIVAQLPAGKYEIDYSLEISSYGNGLPLVMDYAPAPFRVAQTDFPEIVDSGHLGNLVAYHDDGSAQIKLPFTVSGLGLWIDEGETVAIWLTCDGYPCEFGTDSPMRFQVVTLGTPNTPDTLAPNQLELAGSHVHGSFWLPNVPSGEYRVKAELLYSLELDPIEGPEVQFAVLPPEPTTSYQAKYAILGYNNDGTATVNVNGRLVSVQPGYEGMPLDTRLNATLLRFEDIGGFNVPQGKSKVTFVSQGGDDISVDVQVPPPSFTLGPYPLVPENVARADFDSVYEAIRSNNPWYDPYIALGGLNVTWLCENDSDELSVVRHVKNAAALVTPSISGDPYILLNDYVTRREWAYHGSSVWHRSESSESNDWFVPSEVVGHHGTQAPAQEMTRYFNVGLANLFSNKPGAGPGVPYNMTSYVWGPWYSDSSEVRYVIHVKDIELRNGEVVEAHFHFRPERFQITGFSVKAQVEHHEFGACEVRTDHSETRPVAGAPPLQLGGERGLVPAEFQH